MTVPLQPDLAPGRYVVRWKNISDSDGDAGEGAFAFYVGAQPTAADLAADAELDDENAEETQPAATATVAGGETPGAPTPGATPPVNGNDSNGGGANGVLIVAVVAAIAGAVIGFFGVRWFAKRRS
jgi:hypothetical protein